MYFVKPKRMKDKLAACAKDYAKLYRECDGLCSISSNEVHILREDFEKMFPEYETKDRNDDEYPTEEFAVYDGVKFFCLASGQKHEEV